MASQMAEAINEGKMMAQSAMEQRAEAAQSGAVGGAVHIGEGGRIEYVGAPEIELPPVDTGDADGEIGQDVLESSVAGEVAEAPVANDEPGRILAEDVAASEAKSESSVEALTPSEGSLS